MNKHAYLIMTHGDFLLLKKIIELLDDNRNDIFIHFDAKLGIVDEEEFKKVVKKSNLYFIKNRIDVKWGGASQVSAELELFKSAIENEYKYYHLLSGSDLPIKSQNYIHEFFEKNFGKEFVAFKEINTERKKGKVFLFSPRIST